MASDAPLAHVGTLFGARVIVWGDGDAKVTPWDEEIHGASVTARELTQRVGEPLPERPSAHELLTRVEGIGDKRAAALLNHCGDGASVAGRAVSGWAALTDVPGISDVRARGLFDDLREAGVYEQLRYRWYAEADNV